MSLNIVGLVGIADRVTQALGLQVAITHKRWLGDDAFHKPQYEPGVSRMAVVEHISKLVRPTLTHGDQALEKVATARVTFPRSVAVNNRDQIILDDGTTGPILSRKYVSLAGGIPAIELLLGESDQ